MGDAEDNENTMNRDEFWCLIQDCGLAGEISGVVLEGAFAAADSGAGREAEAGDRELDPAEFSECLLRVAKAKQGDGGVLRKFRNMLTRDVLPNACKASGASAFRQGELIVPNLTSVRARGSVAIDAYARALLLSVL